MTARMSALRYARALLGVALAEADPDAVERELAAASDVFTGHAGLWAAMTNPAVPTTRKRAVVDALLPQLEAGPVVRKTLQMLASRDRIALLPGIVEAYRDRLMDHQNVVRASVTSAAALPADRVTKLQQELAAITGRKVVMTSAVDPSIIGGVVTQIGSTVWDGSVKRQLEKIRERLTAAGK